MLTLTSLTSTLLLLAASAPSPAQAEAPAALPKISSISFSGNGCLREPKVTGTFNDPTFTYYNFAASLPGTNQTLNCQVHLQATGASSGWQFALASSTVRGHVVLTPGTSLGYFTTVYFSQNADNTGTLKGTLKNSGSGTLNEEVVLSAKATGANKVWSDCIGSSGYTGIFNVNFRGALSGDSKAYFEALTENWDLEWRRC